MQSFWCLWAYGKTQKGPILENRAGRNLFFCDAISFWSSPRWVYLIGGKLLECGSQAGLFPGSASGAVGSGNWKPAPLILDMNVDEAAGRPGACNGRDLLVLESLMGCSFLCHISQVSCRRDLKTEAVRAAGSHRLGWVQVEGLWEAMGWAAPSEPACSSLIASC